MAKIPSHFQLKNEHQNSYEIHDSRDGSSFQIPKSGLNLDMHAKLAGIKKFSDGGEMDAKAALDKASADEASSRPWYSNFIDSTPQAPPVAPASWDSVQSPAAPTHMLSDSAAPTQAPQAGTAPDPGQPSINSMPSEQPPSSTPQAPGIPQAKTPDVVGQYNSNVGQQVAGIQKESDAKSAQMNESAGIQKTASDSMRDLFAQSQQDLWNQNVQNESLAQQVAAAKIDPDHYMANKSTGNKIMTALSLVVGGIGAGLTRGPNLALETLNHAIANDMEAQKANLDNKKTLLSMNLKKYGDMQTATQATMLQMNAMAQGQLAQVASKYGAQANQGNTQAILGQLKNQALMVGQQLQSSVLEQKIKQHLMSSDVSGQNPLDYVRYVVPADKQKEVATELGKAQMASLNHDRMMQLWDQAQKEQTVMKTGAGYARTSPAITNLIALGDPLIHENEGRVNEFEKRDYENLLPRAGTLDSNQAELRKGFEAFINNKKSAPQARTFGIDIGRFGSTSDSPGARLSGQDKQAFQWAQQNPNDPKAQMIRQKLGIK